MIRIAALFLPVFASLFLLTACYDKVEINDYAYVVTIGLDKYDEEKHKNYLPYGDKENPKFAVSLAIPQMVGEAGQGDSDKIVKHTVAGSIANAIAFIDAASSHKMNFGHAKVVIFSQNLLEDSALFKESLDYFERNQQISMKLIVLATDSDLDELLNASPHGEPMVGLFISKFFKNNERTPAIAYRKDLEDLVGQLRHSGTVLIPNIHIEHKEISFSGASIIKDFKKAGDFDNKLLLGFLWMDKNAKGAIINAAYEGFNIPLNVVTSKCKTEFFEQNGKLICKNVVEASGSIEEYTFDGQSFLDTDRLAALSGVFSGTVKKDIDMTNWVLQKEYGADVHGLLLKLKKNNYPLWTKYKDDWEACFKDMVVYTEVKMTVTGVGVIQ